LAGCDIPTKQYGRIDTHALLFFSFCYSIAGAYRAVPALQESFYSTRRIRSAPVVTETRYERQRSGDTNDIVQFNSPDSFGPFLFGAAIRTTALLKANQQSTAFPFSLSSRALASAAATATATNNNHTSSADAITTTTTITSARMTTTTTITTTRINNQPLSLSPLTPSTAIAAAVMTTPTTKNNHASSDDATTTPTMITSAATMTMTTSTTETTPSESTIYPRLYVLSPQQLSHQQRR